MGILDQVRASTFLWQDGDDTSTDAPLGKHSYLYAHIPKHSKTYVHTHSICLLLDGGAFILLGYSETLAMKPVIYVPAIDVEAHLDVLSYREGWHLDSARLHIAFKLGHKLGPKTDRKTVRVDASPGRSRCWGERKVFQQ